MGEGLLTLDVKTALETIIANCFNNNRILDRMCSILSVSFVMPITSDILHHKLAHIYPLLADDISGYMDSRNCTTIYGETVRGDQDFDNYTEILNEILELNLGLESSIKEAIIVAQTSGDYATKVFLESFLLKVIPLTQSIMLLADKAEMYGSSELEAMKFDHDIKSFGVFGE